MKSVFTNLLVNIDNNVFVMINFTKLLYQLTRGEELFQRSDFVQCKIWVKESLVTMPTQKRTAWMIFHTFRNLLQVWVMLTKKVQPWDKKLSSHNFRALKIYTRDKCAG